MSIRFNVMVCAMLVWSAGSAVAQYKYIGPDGRVVYSDTPPPPAAKLIQKPVALSSPAAANPASTLPFALQQAVKNFPVTIYTTADCDACTQGRNLLSKRGVPFTEKTVKTQEDMKAFKDATAASQVPVMLVGSSSKQLGFEDGAWNTALSSAGYPPNNLLPASYKNPAAAPASPEKPAAQPVQAAQSPPPGAPAAPPPTAITPAAPAEPAANKPSWFKGF